MYQREFVVNHLVAAVNDDWIEASGHGIFNLSFSARCTRPSNARGSVKEKFDFLHISNTEEETHLISKVEINQDRRSLVNRISVNNFP
jgi:hypothetical protein